MTRTFDRIPWGMNPPDTTHERFYPLVRPGIYSPLYVLCVSETIISCPTHWIDNSTQPCLGGKDHCEGCRLACSVRWKCYVGCHGRESGKIGILELTGEAIRHCPRIQGDGRIVRGCHLKVYRRAKYSNAPVVVEVVAEVKPEEVIFAAFDVKPHLGRIWGVLPTKGMHRRHKLQGPHHTEGGAS